MPTVTGRSRTASKASETSQNWLASTRPGTWYTWLLLFLCGQAEFRNSLHNSGSEETFPPSGQIVVAGKVDRELLPWLNFTVRLFILFVHTLFVFLLFDNHNDSVDFLCEQFQLENWTKIFTFAYGQG